MDIDASLRQEVQEFIDKWEGYDRSAHIRRAIRGCGLYGDAVDSGSSAKAAIESFEAEHGPVEEVRNFDSLFALFKLIDDIRSDFFDHGYYATGEPTVADYLREARPGGRWCRERYEDRKHEVIRTYEYLRLLREIGINDSADPSVIPIPSKHDPALCDFFKKSETFKSRYHSADGFEIFRNNRALNLARMSYEDYCEFIELIEKIKESEKMNDARFVETFDTGTVAGNSAQTDSDLKPDLQSALQPIWSGEMAMRSSNTLLMGDRDEIVPILTEVRVEQVLPISIPTRSTITADNSAQTSAAVLLRDRDEIAEILGCESDHNSIKTALYSRICDRHLTLLQNEFHARSRAAGWWPDTAITPETVAVKLALIHSEISEALEGVRKDKIDDHLPHRKACEVELADAIIRILDLAGALSYDIGAAINEKMVYNASRADHKPENRAAPGGKVF